MYKEKLQKLLTENFINDKIDIDRYIRMSEKLENVSETRAKNITELFGLPLGPEEILTAETLRIRNMFSSKYAQCKSINDQNKKNRCLFAVGTAVQKELVKSKNKCKQSKSPERCNKWFDIEINAGNKALQKLKS